jgi:lysozyme
MDLIKRFEGCRLSAYPDPATGEAPWTIGYGCTGTGIQSGVTWSQEEADSELALRLKYLAGSVANHVSGLNDNEFSAIVAFTYNVGIGNLLSSTLLKMVQDDDIEGASQQFLAWDKAAGKVMQGLLNRRQAEMELFLTPVEES